MDSDCSDAVPNSECSGGTCQCASGYYSSNGGTECTLRQVGDSCTVDSDCADAVANAVCNGGVCECAEGYLAPNDTVCVLRTVGDSCGSDVDCSAAVANSTCVGGSCECVSGYMATADNTGCQRREFAVPYCCEWHLIFSAIETKIIHLPSMLRSYIDSLHRYADNTSLCVDAQPKQFPVP